MLTIPIWLLHLFQGLEFSSLGLWVKLSSIHWAIFLPHVLRKTKVVYEGEQLALGVRRGRETGANEPCKG